MEQNVPMRFYTARGRCFADIRPATREFGWPRRNMFMQPLAEATLRRGLDRFPSVTPMWGHALERLDQDAGRVKLALRSDAGEPVSVAADYVVGSDGGRSAVRGLLGVPLLGRTSPVRWLVIDIRNDPLDAPYSALHCDPVRPHVSIFLPHNHRRWEFMLFPDEDEAEMTRPATIDRLLARYVRDPAGIEIVRTRIYTHHSRLAERFRVGRVFLAGDAAHLMPPWAGQGMNSGIRDATNLAWKLASVVRGRAADTLLDSYEAERRDHSAKMIGLSDMMGAIFSPTNRMVALLRDAFFRAANLAPPVKRYVLQMRFKPLPRYTVGIVLAPARRDRASPVGRMFIQPRVAIDGGEPALLDAVLGRGFAVLGAGLDPARSLAADEKAHWQRIGIRFVRAAPRTGSAAATPAPAGAETVTVDDVDGDLFAWFARQPGAIVVLRPDRYVAAVATSETLPAVMQQLRALLGAGTG
jgi:3-(3-hydroxy-phenyl)propionate hydroxylase